MTLFIVVACCFVIAVGLTHLDEVRNKIRSIEIEMQQKNDRKERGQK